MNTIDKNIIRRACYSTDVSIYEIMPGGVATPRSEQDIKLILDLCIKDGLTITPRGAGTSTAGQAIGSGIVIDHSAFMNKILETGKDHVDVQPGIILTYLNKELAKKGLFFPVDPSSIDVCTVGGMVGNNSSGIHSFLYGDTKDYVIGLEGFWPDGKFFSTITGINIDSVLQKLLPLKKEALAVRQHLPKTSKNSSGYNILEALTEKGISINHLLTGSEGTLCLMTKIRLKVLPLPQKRITVLSLFDKFDKALEAVEVARKLNGISAIELLDRELIDITREFFPEFKSFFESNINAGLLFEIDGDSDFVEAQYKGLSVALFDLAIKTEVATSDEKRKQLWWFRRSASTILNRIDDSTRPLKFIEDVAVPFEKIIEFYNAEKKLLDNYGLRTAFFGHIGTGHFHINPRINTRKTGAQQKISEIGKKTYELVRSLGGTFSAEHGDGVLREPYIRELQPELYQLFYQIKDTLDPGWTLNPGKIVSKDKHEPRSRYDFTPAKKVPTILLNAVEKCHGCNDCIHFCMAKNAYARNRANIIRNIMNGTIRSKKDINDAVNYIERCHGCGKCLTECPAAVDLLNTASLLREYGVIRISTLKGFMMKLLMPLRDLLQRKLDACDNNVEFKVPRIFNPVLRLGLYYKPYTREILNIVKIKNISLAVTDNDLQRYLTLSK